jgi:hypothetical protein
VFRGGRNIALKVLPHWFDRTVAFYRDVLGSTGVARCAEMERLTDGFWVADPAGIVHLVAHPVEGPGP